jgi:hypothetical protein
LECLGLAWDIQLPEDLGRDAVLVPAGHGAG